MLCFVWDVSLMRFSACTHVFWCARYDNDEGGAFLDETGAYDPFASLGGMACQSLRVTGHTST